MIDYLSLKNEVDDMNESYDQTEDDDLKGKEIQTSFKVVEVLDGVEYLVHFQRYCVMATMAM